MIAMRDHEQCVLEVVESIHDELELPEGYRAEIIGGQIVVAGPLFGKQAFVLEEIREVAHNALPEDHDLYGNVSLKEPGGDRYIPGLALLPDALLKTNTVWLFPAAACLLAVEVAPPKHAQRAYRKAAGFARAGTAVYLLVDQDDRKCVVHAESEDGAYRTVVEVPFGEDVLLPLSKPITIDTSRF